VDYYMGNKPHYKSVYDNDVYNDMVNFTHNVYDMDYYMGNESYN
jgi:hypothetical protein